MIYLANILPLASCALLAVGSTRQQPVAVVAGAAVAGLLAAFHDGLGLLLTILVVLSVHALSQTARQFLRREALVCAVAFLLAALLALAGLPSLGMDLSSLLAVLFDDSIIPSQAVTLLMGSAGLPGYILTIVVLSGYGLFRAR